MKLTIEVHHVTPTMGAEDRVGHALRLEAERDGARQRAERVERDARDLREWNIRLESMLREHGVELPA